MPTLCVGSGTGPEVALFIQRPLKTMHAFVARRPIFDTHHKVMG